MARKPTNKTASTKRVTKAVAGEGEAEVVTQKARAEKLRIARRDFAKELGAAHIFDSGYSDFWLERLEGCDGEDLPAMMRANYHLTMIPEYVQHKGQRPFYCPISVWPKDKVACYVTFGDEGEALDGAQLWLFRVVTVKDPLRGAERAGVASKYVDLYRTRVYALPDELKGPFARAPRLEWWKGTQIISDAQTNQSRTEDTQSQSDSS